MEEETKKLLADNYALNKDNNEMLHKLISYQKWNQIYKIVYWSIIILSAIGAFYFIQPLLGNLFSVYTGGVGTTKVNSIKDINKLGSSNEVKDLINSLNN